MAADPSGGFTPGWAIAIQGVIYIIASLLGYLGIGRKVDGKGEEVKGATAAQSTVDDIKDVVDEHTDEFKAVKAQLFEMKLELAALKPKKDADPNYVPIEKKKP